MARGPIPDFPADRPKVPEAVAAAQAYCDGHSMGGNLHIVLDDGNLEPSCIEWSAQRAVEQGDDECVRVAAMLLAMTPTQRRRVYRLVNPHRRLRLN